MPRKPKPWKWTTGGYGTTVVVYERYPGSVLYIGVPRPKGGYRGESLGHRDKDRAMQAATKLVAVRHEGIAETRGPLTVAGMFALYLKSVEGEQSRTHRADTERAAEMWTRYLGGDFKVERFSQSDWEAFRRLRESGEVDARGHRVTEASKREPVGPRVLAKDLKVLRAACRRAALERLPLPAIGFLLAFDPTRDLRLPVEKNPRRPIVDDDRATRIMAVAHRVTMRVGRGKEARDVPSPLPLLLQLAHDTGRRLSAILALRASDWRPNEGTHGRILWRADSDKLGRAWLAPVTPKVREVLEAYRKEKGLVGEALLFPAPNSAAKPVDDQRAIDWLRRAEKLAGLEPLAGGAWHPFRRKWATERKDLSPKDVAAVGGWTDLTTLQKVYQVADQETMEAVVMQPKRLRKMG
jgi:integrase